MKYEVSHRSLYIYDTPVAQSQHRVHMSPRPVPRQVVHGHDLIVDPLPAMRYDGTDAFGNPVTLLDIERPHEEFLLHACSTIEVAAPAALDPAMTTPWERLEIAHAFNADRVDLDVIQYRCDSRLTMPTFDIAAYGEASFTPGRPVLEAAIDLTRRIYADFKFDPAATDISTPVSEVFRQRRGVCQDFAHLALATLRAMRVPARYVSGYILTRPPPGQPKLRGADASHAWVSVWSPETGWVDLDPTNGVVVADEHIAIAWGRDYDDISPISGVLLGGGTHTVAVGVDVVPLG